MTTFRIQVHVDHIARLLAVGHIQRACAVLVIHPVVSILDTALDQTVAKLIAD